MSETYESKQVQPAIALLSALTRIEDDGVLMELLLFNRHINTDDILPDNTSSTDVQVSVRVKKREKMRIC